MFDLGFADLIASENYNPSKYKDPDEEEEWGNLDTQVQYREEITYETKLPPPLHPQEKAFSAKPSPLAQKYFNVGKPVAKTTQEGPKPEEKMQQLVEHRIQQLNQEISNFKKESKQLKRAKIQLEEQNRVLAKEQKEHGKAVSENRAAVQSEIDNELEEFKKKVRVRERNQKVLASVPSKKEREEKEELKGAINRLQEELKVRKSRYQMNKERLRKATNEAQEKNNELMQQIGTIKELYGTPPKRHSLFEENHREAQTPEVLEIPCEGLQTTDETISAEGPLVPQEHIELPEYTETIPLVSQQTYPDGNTVKLYITQHKEILYKSGTRTEIYPNGYSVVFYTNEDVKQTFPDGKTVYFYADRNTTHSMFPNGSQEIRFGNGQIEKHYSDGKKKVKFIDGTVRLINVDGSEETVYPDSTKETVGSDGEKVIWHPGGHCEVIKTDGSRCRVYYNQGGN